MNLCVFPAICVYFLIGALLGKICRLSDIDDEIEAAIWFIFWPFVFITIIAAIVMALIIVILKYLAKVLLKLHRYFNTF